jgi:hypothetical protein
VVAEQREKEDSDGLGKVRGEGVEAEEPEADGDEPVRERRFFQIADAVDMQGYEVTGERHVPGCVGVGGVGVVEQRRREEGGEEDDEPQAAEEEDGGRASWRAVIE